MRDFTLRWDSLSCCFRLHSSRFSPLLPPLPLAHCGSSKVVSSLRGARELSLLAIALYAQTLTLLSPLPPSLSYYVYYTLICFRPASSCCHIKQLWPFPLAGPCPVPVPLVHSVVQAPIEIFLFISFYVYFADTHTHTHTLMLNTHSIAHTLLAISWHRL